MTTNNPSVFQRFPQPHSIIPSSSIIHHPSSIIIIGLFFIFRHQPTTSTTLAQNQLDIKCYHYYLSYPCLSLQGLERHRRMNSTPNEDLICTGCQSRMQRSSDFPGNQVAPPENEHFAPENGGPLEKEIPDLETTILRGELLVLGRVRSRCLSLVDLGVSKK